MRLAGTRRRNAKALAERPASFRISARCSPGWMGLSFFAMLILSWLVIVHHFHVFGSVVFPHEANSVPIVDANAVLALAFVLQCGSRGEALHSHTRRLLNRR